MVGIYSDIRLDPVSRRKIAFNVSFESIYSTACIEAIECFWKNRSDHDFDSFFGDMKAMQTESEVKARFLVFINFVVKPFSLTKRRLCSQPRRSGPTRRSLSTGVRRRACSSTRTARGMKVRRSGAAGTRLGPGRRISCRAQVKADS